MGYLFDPSEKVGGFNLFKERSILQSVLLAATSALSFVYILRRVQDEENTIWRIVGYGILASTAFGVLLGISQILAQISAKKATVPDEDVL